MESYCRSCGVIVGHGELLCIMESYCRSWGVIVGHGELFSTYMGWMSIRRYFISLSFSLGLLQETSNCSHKVVSNDGIFGE